MSERASCLYEGRVRHRRFRPHAHEFSYSICLLYLDLDELPGLFEGRWLWSNEGRTVASFRRADHLGNPRSSLKDAVRQLVEDRTGQRIDGPVRLLTHPRYFGYGFNPVSFFYCFDAGDSRVETIVAEVSNTPWGERHCYVLTENANSGTVGKKRYRFPKSFHVSPFLGMDYDYDWRFVAPGDHLVVHMDNLDRKDPRTDEPSPAVKTFDATMNLRRREIEGTSLARALARYPFMTAKVVGAVYFEALRLWMKRTPFIPHPRRKIEIASDETSASRTLKEAV